MKFLKQKNKILKLQNNGFSLVEVLLSLTVLSIIALPISTLFLASSSISARSARLSSASQVAENIAQQLQSSSIGEIDVELQSSAPVLSGITGEFVMPDNVNGKSVYSPFISENDIKNDIYIEYRGITSGQTVFNAIVTIKKNSTLNETLLFESAPMDYVAAQTRQEQYDTDKHAWQAFLIECANKGYKITDEAQFKKRVTAEKLTTIDVKVQNGFLHVVASYSYNFKYPTIESDETIVSYDTNHIYSWPTGQNSAQTLLTPQQGISLQKNDERRHSLYLMYFPWYFSKETFVINNYNDIELNLFLVKQLDSTLGENELTVGEFNYKPFLTVNESDNNVMNTLIHTNMGNNISPVGGKLHANYIFGTDVFEPQPIAKKNTQERMYDITIDIFDVDSADTGIVSNGPIYTLNVAVLE